MIGLKLSITVSFFILRCLAVFLPKKKEGASRPAVGFCHSLLSKTRNMACFVCFPVKEGRNGVRAYDECREMMTNGMRVKIASVFLANSPPSFGPPCTGAAHSGTVIKHLNTNDHRPARTGECNIGHQWPLPGDRRWRWEMTHRLFISPFTTLRFQACCDTTKNPTPSLLRCSPAPSFQPADSCGACRQYCLFLCQPRPR